MEKNIFRFVSSTTTEQTPKITKVYSGWTPTQKDIDTVKDLIDKCEFVGDTELEGRKLLTKMRVVSRQYKRRRNE